MSWILLLAAGLLEACWAVGLKQTDGFTKPIPSILVGLAIAASMILLALAVREIPIGTAYAVWVGIGVVGAAAGQALFFNQPLTLPQGLFLALLLVAVAGLKMTSAAK
jgi:quaternary ammonium compound-resistance protein SugE